MHVDFVTDLSAPENLGGVENLQDLLDFAGGLSYRDIAGGCCSSQESCKNWLLGWN